MKTRFLLLAVLLFTHTAYAQNAKTILDKVSSTYANAGGLTVGFTLNIEETKSKTTYSHDGTALMKGDKFRIEVPDGITWFDGKTQWVFAKGGDEVNVSNPSGDELASISPAAFLSLYKAGFKLNYKGESKEKGKVLSIVEMIPTRTKEYTKFLVYIDKATNLFSKVSLFAKDGTNTHLIINKLQSGVTHPDATFSFNKKQYPNVEIVDLR